MFSPEGGPDPPSTRICRQDVPLPPFMEGTGPHAEGQANKDWSGRRPCPIPSPDQGRVGDLPVPATPLAKVG